MSTIHALMSRFPAILDRWLARYEQRRALRDLDDHALRDIGLTWQQACAEAARPCWAGCAELTETPSLPDPPAERDVPEQRCLARSEKHK